MKKLRLLRNTPKNNNLSELENDIQELKANYEVSRIRKYAKIFLVGFFFGRDSENKVAELTAKIQIRIKENISEISKLIHEIGASGIYLIYPKKANCFSRIENVKSEITACEKNNVLSTKFIGEMRKSLDESKQFVLSYNPKFIKQRKIDYKHLWSKGAISLDDEQQTAIVTDDKYNLVVAAAGSGKTEVLITRIAYLIQRKPDSVQPNRILAIAYQRKAKEQIEQRLCQRYGITNVNVKTFHKLGKEILERSGRRIEKTDIVDENKKFGFVKSYFEENVATNPEFYKLFIRYIKTVHDKEDEPTDSDKDAVVTHAKERKYISINGTKVNSNAEKEIMDYLLTHKANGNPIEVKYEPDLDGFRPDFYLPQFDIFIEHWGIDKDGNVPQFFSQSSEEYRDSMELKKKWFAEHNRMLAQTYSYEFNPEEPEMFYELLKEKLQKTLKKTLLFTPLTYEEILELIWESQKTPIDDIQNFITIAKTYGLNPDNIAKKLENNNWSSKQLSFGRLALNVFRSYEAQLKRLGKTDFEDMINEATVALDSNEDLCKNIYDHILVDEYQDISTQRLNLLKRLLERNPNCKFFCVGDDWQSIMGFSGSNLNFFVNFSDYFENPAVSQICTNYRSIESIVDAGAELIKNNGKKQMQKPALSNRKEIKPILVLGSPHQESFDKQYCRQIVEDCLGRINEYIGKGYSPDDILVLTRFMRTKILGRSQFFKIVQTFHFLAKVSGIKVSIDNAKESNAIRLLTVHKCKGLEARVVFILNVVSGEFGFPSEIEDPSILEVARGDNGIQSQIEEERRLFYVAITRAKEDLYIYTRLNNKSEFLAEISGYTQSVYMNY
ncbi:MAG: UvrD-helicase domain-containing protein [Candidatus Bathyarchaeia archaeon]